MSEKQGQFQETESQNFVNPWFSKALVLIKPKVLKNRPRLSIIELQSSITQTPGLILQTNPKTKAHFFAIPAHSEEPPSPP